MKLQGDLEKQQGIYYEAELNTQPIGIGGMGRVYKGWRISGDGTVKTPVAIKFVFEDLPRHAVARAKREASIQLVNDNLLHMLAFIPTTGKDARGNTVEHYHVVSELLHGVTLSDLLEGKTTDFEGKSVPYAEEMLLLHSRQPEKFATVIVRQVLEGLMALHNNGYIHRDIDPSNIMLTADRHVKLLDFGIAKKLDMLDDDDSDYQDDPCQTERLVGKMKYAAPELARSDVASQNATTDIYAVGILLYQLLCGHLPFDGKMKEVMEKQINKPMPLEDISDKKLRDIVGQATEKQQEKRYQTAADFANALADTQSAPRPPVPIAVIISALAAAGIAVGIIVALLI